MIIFLDIDGVIATSESYKDGDRSRAKLPYNRVEHHTAFLSDKCIAVLNKLTDHLGATIIISSAWRNLFEFETLKRMLLKRGVKAPIVGHTELTRSGTSPRGLEILNWMRGRGLDPAQTEYLIIDDWIDDISRRHPPEKILHTGNDAFYGEGLTEELIAPFLK